MKSDWSDKAGSIVFQNVLRKWPFLFTMLDFFMLENFRKIIVKPRSGKAILLCHGLSRVELGSEMLKKRIDNCHRRCMLFEYSKNFGSRFFFSNKLWPKNVEKTTMTENSGITDGPWGRLLRYLRRPKFSRKLRMTGKYIIHHYITYAQKLFWTCSNLLQVR